MCRSWRPRWSPAACASCTDPAVALAGQGIRDVTRIAASDPQLWTQILAGNAAAVRDVLLHVQTELAEVLGALDTLGPTATVSAPARCWPGSWPTATPATRGSRASTARRPRHTSVVVVLVPDRPGELARLLHDVGDAGVNLEDLHLEHGMGQPFGLAEVSVLPAVAERLAAS